MVFLPNITTNHAITYTNQLLQFVITLAALCNKLEMAGRKTSKPNNKYHHRQQQQQQQQQQQSVTEQGAIIP